MSDDMGTAPHGQTSLARLFWVMDRVRIDLRMC